LDLKSKNQQLTFSKFFNCRLLELRRRFEAPIEKNRWDFPLFRVFSKPATLLSKDDNASGSQESQATTIGDKETLNGNILLTEKLNTLTGTSTAMNGGDSLTPPLTSTRGQIDINCLAIDGTARMEYRVDDTFEKPVNVKTSSWRPKVRTTDSSVVSRTFTTLEKESNPAKLVDVAPKDSSLSASSALTISGSVPTVVPDDNEDSLDIIMSRVYLHLTNVSQLAAPNSSTISVPRVHADLLHELDRTSQNITQRIVTHQTDSVEGLSSSSSTFIFLFLHVIQI
jgi:Chromatin associated protein KTI12